MSICNIPELAKGNNMIERDLAVLEALSSGPATLHYLHRMFSKKPDGKMVSKRTFNDYISRMANDEYFKVVEYKDRSKMNSGWTNKFAVIDVRGADLICRIIPYKEREHIRMEIPLRSQYVFELALSNIIRKIWQEARDRDTFAIEHVHDEPIQKKIYIRQHGRTKGVFFPDLEAIIKPHKDDRSIKINIELDTGQKTCGYWVEKIFSWSTPILVICTNPSRIETLSYSVNSNNDRLKAAVVFISYDAFINQNYAIGWLNSLPSGKKMVYLYKDYSTIPSIVDTN